MFGFKENGNIAYVGVFGGFAKIVIYFIGFILCSKQDENDQIYEYTENCNVNPHLTVPVRGQGPNKKKCI